MQDPEAKAIMGHRGRINLTHTQTRCTLILRRLRVHRALTNGAFNRSVGESKDTFAKSGSSLNLPLLFCGMWNEETVIISLGTLPNYYIKSKYCMKIFNILFKASLLQ